MNSGPLLNYDPPELSFQFEQNRELPSSSIRLLNNTEDYVAFKLKSTNPINYVVRPRIGILSPRSTCEIQVRVVKEAKRRDKFMIQSAVAAPDTRLEDARNLFDKDAGHPFQGSILRVVYNRSRESSPATSVTENADPPTLEADNSVVEPRDNGLQVTSSMAEPQDNDLQVTDCITQPQNDVSGQQYPVNEDNISGNGKSILGVIITKFPGDKILREGIGFLLMLISLYLMKQTISWIWSLVMFIVMLVIKMIKKLVSDSFEDWIVKALMHIFVYIFYGRNTTTHA